jgi:hypothetical protein
MMEISILTIRRRLGVFESREVFPPAKDGSDKIARLEFPGRESINSPTVPPSSGLPNWNGGR